MIAWITRHYGPIWLALTLISIAFALTAFTPWWVWAPLSFVGGFVGAILDDLLGFTGPATPSQGRGAE